MWNISDVESSLQLLVPYLLECTQVCLHASNSLPHHQPHMKNYANSKNGHHDVGFVSDTKNITKTYASRSRWALLELDLFCQRKAVEEQTEVVAVLPATVHCEALLLTVVDVERR